MNPVWHSFPIRNTRCDSSEQDHNKQASKLDKQVSELSKVVTNGSSYFAELKKDSSGKGIYHVEVKKVRWYHRLFGSEAERALKTEDAIVQFVRDNKELLGKNQILLEAPNSKESQGSEKKKTLGATLIEMAEKTNSFCKKTENFVDAQAKIYAALEEPSKWMVEFVPGKDGTGYKVEKREVTSFFDRYLKPTSWLKAASQAVAAKFMHDNFIPTETIDRTSRVGISVLTGALAGYQANAPKNRPALIDAEIQIWTEAEKDSLSFMKFAKEREELFIQKTFANRKEKMTALATLNKAAKEENDPEAKYLLALYSINSSNHNSSGNFREFEKSIKSIINSSNDTDSWVLKHCKKCLEESSSMFKSSGYIFPLDPFDKYGMKVATSGGIIHPTEMGLIEKPPKAE